jgi:hypothetical protein
MARDLDSPEARIPRSPSRGARTRRTPSFSWRHTNKPADADGSGRWYLEIEPANAAEAGADLLELTCRRPPPRHAGWPGRESRSRQETLIAMHVLRSFAGRSQPWPSCCSCSRC